MFPQFYIWFVLHLLFIVLQQAIRNTDFAVFLFAIDAKAQNEENKFNLQEGSPDKYELCPTA